MPKHQFHHGMIDASLKAAEAIRDSKLAPELKRHGFTPASMRQQANTLAELHTRVQMAKDDLASAIAALQTEAKDFAQRWSTYSNLVRGLTSDVALRNEHGVGTPGRRKGPAVHRAPRIAKAAPVNGAENESQAVPSTTNGNGAARYGTA